MNEETVTYSGGDTALNRAAEAYLRELAAGGSPQLAEFANQFRVDEEKLRAFANDYRWFSELAQRSSSTDHAQSPSVVRAFGDYELLGDPLGRGGMGVVYKARQVSLDRTVAVKLILAGVLATPAEIRRFYEEARLAGRLQHPQIVSIYEVGCVEGQHFYSMEFIAGQTLDALIQEKGPGKSRDTATCLLACARAVAYAHSEGVIHRDLKPSNILIDSSNRPRLADFGLAKQLHGDSQATETLGVLGTPSYMAPEQARGASKLINEQTDVYGLGAVLYKMLTGIPPFQGASALDVIKRVILDEPLNPKQLNGEIPDDLATICLKCLQKTTSARYVSAAALADEFVRFLNHEPIFARPVGRLSRLAMQAKRRPLITSLIVLLGVSLCMGLAGVTSQYIRAEGAFQEARRNLDRAQSNLEQAIDALNFVGHEIGEVELSSLPRMQKLQRRILERAVVFNESLLRENRDSPSAEWEVAQANLRIANLRSVLGQHKFAEAAYKSAIQSLQTFAANNGSDVDVITQLLRAQYGLANLYIDTNRFQESTQLLATLRAGLTRRPDRKSLSIEELELQSAIECLAGRQLLHERHFAAAAEQFAESLDSIRLVMLREGTSDNYLRDEAHRYIGLGASLRQSGRTAEAIEAYQLAIRNLEELGQDVQLGIACRDLAIAYRRGEDWENALDAYQRAREVFAPLVQFSPESVRLRSEYAETFHGEALIQLELGQINDAVANLEHSVVEQRKAVQEAPEVVDFCNRLRNELYSLCWAYLENGNHDAAATNLEEFLTLGIQPIDQINAAKMFVGCRDVVLEDERLATAARQQQGEAYDQQAIAVLRSAREKELISAETLQSVQEFKSLHKYAEYGSLLK